MERLRTHHFDQGNVITGLCPNGEFGAYLEREEGRIRGYGHTRIGAIADLLESVECEEPEAVDQQTADFDHNQDHRKNWT